MLISRVYWLALASGLAAFTVGAQAPDPVVLGTHRVHPTRILARFAEPLQATSLSTLSTLKAEGLTVSRHYQSVPGGVVLELKPTATVMSTQPASPQEQAQALAAKMTALRNSGLFSYVGPDYWEHTMLTEPDDARYQDGTLWGLNNYGQNGGKPGADVIHDPSGSSTNAWDITTGNASVIIAVIDTGVRYTHKDLASQMWINPNPDPIMQDVHGINAMTGSGDPMDDVGHGTHVSGTIGAAANNGYPHVGVTWNVQIMACKFIGQNGGYDSDAITCIEYAVGHGAKAMNNSWGGGGFDQVMLDAIIAASTNNVMFFAAAGNSGLDNDLNEFYPANFQSPNVIAVAALDRKDNLASFSDYGLTTVHIGAPGVEVFSCFNGSDTDYAVLDGTSMATPHVTGVAALIYSVAPNATVAEVRQRILGSAVPVSDLQNKSVTGGRVNAYRALTAKADGILKMNFTPVTNSIVLLSTNLPIFVSLNDLFPVTNAVVTGQIVGSTNTVTFHNDGLKPDVLSNDNVYSTFVDVTPYTNAPFSNVLTMIVTAVATNNFPQTNTVGHGTNTVVYYIVGPPENDNFANGDKVPAAGAFADTLILATNTYATIEPGEPAHGGLVNSSFSLWWNWSPAVSAPTLVDTAGSSFDTVVAVYTGNSVGQLTQVAAGLSGAQKANLTFNAQQGATYRIVVAGANTNQFGNIRLRIQPNGQLDVTPPIAIIGDPLNGKVITSPKITVTGTASDPAPNASGVKQVLLSVNTGLPAGTTGTGNWSSPVTLQKGANTIKVFAQDYAGNDSSVSSIIVTYQPVLATNDIFGPTTDPSSPYYLRAASGSSTVTNVAATKETGEPNHAGNDGGKSVWWTWQAPANGVLTVDTQGSNFDTLLGVYTGIYVYALTTVASNDDALPNVKWSKVALGVQAGQAYHIAVDGFGGASGTVVMNYQFAPTNLVTVAVGATAGGTVTPATGTFTVPVNSAQTFLASPSNAFDFVEWQGSVTSFANPLSFTVKSNVTLNAVFLPHLFTDDFESGGFSPAVPWQFAGNLPWTVTSSVAFAGQYSARSGAIGDNQTSSLLLSAPFRAGTGSFMYRVSSEPGWDWLEFYLDNQRIGRWSGEVDWTQFLFPTSAGTHSLEWRYTKDPANSLGLDAVFIDNVDLPFAVAPDGSSPARLSLQPDLSGQLVLTLQGQTNQLYLTQFSEDLSHWQPFSTNVAVRGQVHLLVPVDVTQRFYRALVAP
jgi:subtilisin family serine protease